MPFTPHQSAVGSGGKGTRQPASTSALLVVVVPVLRAGA